MRKGRPMKSRLIILFSFSFIASSLHAANNPADGQNAAPIAAPAGAPIAAPADNLANAIAAIVAVDPAVASLADLVAALENLALARAANDPANVHLAAAANLARTSAAHRRAVLLVADFDDDPVANLK